MKCNCKPTEPCYHALADVFNVPVRRIDFASFTATPHERFGNERSWSVTGGTLKRGQVVTLHAMCNAKSAIKKAIRADLAERAGMK
jgi:hypothetical protein